MYTENPYKLTGPSPLALRPTNDALATTNGTPPPAAPAPEHKSPREWLFLVMWRQKVLILAAVILCLLGALVYLQVKTPIFASKAQVLVTPASLLAPGAESGTHVNNEKFLFTQVELFTSSAVLQLVTIQKPIVDGQIFKGIPPDQLVRHMQEEVVVAEADKNSDIITITAKSEDPKHAALIANAVVAAYKDFLAPGETEGQNRSGAEKQISVLQKSLEDSKRDLERKMAERLRLEKTHGILSLDRDQNSVAQRSLQSLNDKLLEARNETIRAESDYEEARKRFGDKAADIEKLLEQMDDFSTTSPQEQAVLRAEISQARTLLQELEARYGPNHPSIQTLTRRIDRLNLQYLNSIYRRYLAAKRIQQELQNAYDEERNKAVAMNGHLAEYALVREDVDRLQKQVHGFEDRIGALLRAQTAGENTVKVVAAAKPEDKPAIPNKMRTLAVALALGLLCGLLLGCMREWIDDRFAGAGDIKSSLGMPVLAVVPQTPTKRSPSVSGQRILLDPASDAAEAYRSLRTAVQFSAPPGQLKTLLITSPTPGDGKTTLVSNLAIAMAQAGKKTIVVDVDLRRPTQHEIFNCKNTTGLSALLAGRCSLETAIQRTSVQNLEILPCGPVPANPAEILNSREFGEMLEQLADKYDYVVIDSPPVHTVADARIIAASCDATVMVIKAQTAHRRQAESARDLLVSVGARIIGVVVNDLPRRPSHPYGGGSSTGGTASPKRLVAGLTSQEQAVVETGPR